MTIIIICIIIILLTVAIVARGSSSDRQPIIYPKHDDAGRKRNPLARAQSGLARWSCSSTCSSPSDRVKLRFIVTGNAERRLYYTSVPLVSSKKRCRRRRRRTPTEHNDRLRHTHVHTVLQWYTQTGSKGAETNDQSVSLHSQPVWVGHTRSPFTSLRVVGVAFRRLRSGGRRHQTAKI